MHKQNRPFSSPRVSSRSKQNCFSFRKFLPLKISVFPSGLTLKVCSFLEATSSQRVSNHGRSVNAPKSRLWIHLHYYSGINVNVSVNFKVQTGNVSVIALGDARISSTFSTATYFSRYRFFLGSIVNKTF